jgi:hypothetical protein
LLNRYDIPTVSSGRLPGWPVNRLRQASGADPVQRRKARLKLLVSR